MDELLGFFMENIVIIAIILIGIISKIGSATKGQNQEEQSRPQRPTPTPSGKTSTSRGTVYRTSETAESRTVTQPELTTSSIQEQQKQQMERLANRLNRNTDPIADDSGDMDVSLGASIQDAIKHQGKSNSFYKKEQFKKQVKTGLNKDGLVQGIIMSEVLGPPRARKPYRSVIEDRRK